MTAAHTYFEWDQRTWSRALRLWSPALARLEAGATGPLRCLEVGGRRGGLSQWLADRGHSVVLTDIDAEDPQIDGEQRVAPLDVTNLDGFDERGFDVIVIKSVLGSIASLGGAGAVGAAQQNLVRLVRPGGVVLFAENLRATPAHALLRRLLVPWSSRWHYFTYDELFELMGRGCEVQMGHAGIVGLLGRSERQRHWLARVDTMVERVLPGEWHYLGYGCATRESGGGI